MSSVIVCNTSLFHDFNVKTQSKFDKKKEKKRAISQKLYHWIDVYFAKYKETEASFK